MGLTRPQAIHNQHPKLSVYDTFALAIAKFRGIVLLTGDGRLRKTAAEEGVTVRGTLWIFDELIRNGKISEEEYRGFMLELKKQNGSRIRLPESEIDRRMDCDNDHSDNPEDWITPEHVRRAFPDTTFAVHFSRNNMKEKRGKAPRPKFHVLFLIDEITDPDEYSDLKKRVSAVFPYFDTRALDATRFFYGTETPQAEFCAGSITLNECLELYYPEATEETFWALDSAHAPTIPEGRRNSTLSHFAGRVLKRYTAIPAP